MMSLESVANDRLRHRRETMAVMAPGGVADGTRLDAEVGDGLAVGRRVVGTRAPWCALFDRAHRTAARR